MRARMCVCLCECACGRAARACWRVYAGACMHAHRVPHGVRAVVGSLHSPTRSCVPFPSRARSLPCTCALSRSLRRLPHSDLTRARSLVGWRCPQGHGCVDGKRRQGWRRPGRRLCLFQRRGLASYADGRIGLLDRTRERFLKELGLVCRRGLGLLRLLPFAFQRARTQPA